MKRLLAALLFAAPACAPAPEEFPVGFFGVETPEGVEALAPLGFNAFQSYSKSREELRAVSDAARRRGALHLAPPDRLREAESWRGPVWYIADEPEVVRMPASRLAEIDAETRRWAPGARTAFAVGDGRRAVDYLETGDYLMVDWYPVPHLALESAGDHVRLAAAAAGRRGLWAILQAMDWRDFPQGRAKAPKKVGRFPDAAEIRFMSYDAVLGGASGVWYYAFTRPDGTTLAEKPFELRAVAATAREMRAMAPIFARGRAIPLPFPAPADGWAARAWTYRGRDYLVLANRMGNRMWKVPKAALEPAWRPLFEVRRDPRELLYAHRGEHYLKPYQVLVLESRLRPRRFFGK